MTNSLLNLILLFHLVSCDTVSNVTKITTVDLSSYRINSESCAVSESQNTIYLSKRLTSNPGPASITSDISKLLINSPNLNFPISSNLTGNFTSGMDIIGNNLYIATFEGIGFIQRFDLSSNSYQETYKQSIQYGLNGVCHDPDNRDLLYVTTTGINWGVNPYEYDNGEGIWSINISKDPWNVTKIWNGGDTLQNTNYTVHPNGCVGTDGTIYFVETRLDSGGKLIIYHTNKAGYKWSAIDGVGTADGLVYSNKSDTFYYDGSGRIGKFVLDATKMSFSVQPTNIITGLSSPGDMCLDESNGVLIVPDQIGKYDLFRLPGYTFDPPTNQPTTTPTTKPTNMLTLTPNTATTTTLLPSQAMDQSSTFRITNHLICFVVTKFAVYVAY